MTATVWSKFFWADWLSDAGLRTCSLGARGLWMDMLCVAASHEPIGYVAISGVGLTNIEIAMLSGAEISVVEQLLKELEKHQVFNRTKDGVIYSRRLIRDNKRALAAKANGKMGGNPSLRKHKRKSGSDNPAPGARARASICQSPDRILPLGGESERPGSSEENKISGSHSPVSGPATALPTGAPARNGKRPHELTKAEFEAQLKARRKP